MSFHFVDGFLCYAKDFNNFPPVCCFYFLCFRRQIKKIVTIYVKLVMLMFSSRIFKDFGLIFRYLIHFEFIFVYSVRECSNFIVLHVAVQYSQHKLLKTLSLLHCIFLPPLL